jgi:hypothetical protein
MKLKTLLSLVAFCFTTAFSATAIAEDAPQSVHKLVPSIKDWGNNAVLIAAVNAQNAKGMSLDDIKAKDATWIKTTGLDNFMKSLMNNDAAKEMKNLERSKPFFLEIFLMDNQGANVAMTNKTSDYWQGDEAKFTNAYKAGAGGVDISKVKFDKSSQAYLVQVSVPVMDGGKAIGAISVGINLDELEK